MANVSLLSSAVKPLRRENVNVRKKSVLIHPTIKHTVMAAARSDDGSYTTLGDFGKDDGSHANFVPGIPRPPAFTHVVPCPRYSWSSFEDEGLPTQTANEELDKELAKCSQVQSTKKRKKVVAAPAAHRCRHYCLIVGRICLFWARLYHRKKEVTYLLFVAY